jgi:hypothetical protein
MKIGITERGDPSLDMSWVDKMNSVDGAIIITKNLTRNLSIHLLYYKRQVILHHTITGMGGSWVEPNIPKKEEQYKALRNLLQVGFPANQVVVRIDPVMPTIRGAQNLRIVISDIKSDPVLSQITRFRMSVLDGYYHVMKRMANGPVNLAGKYNGSLHANKETFEFIDKVIAECSNDFGVRIEACGELELNNAIKVGCISTYDVDVLGIPRKFPYDKELKPAYRQRSECYCPACKTELLSGNREPCGYKCLYCYWKDN